MFVDIDSNLIKDKSGSSPEIENNEPYT